VPKLWGGQDPPIIAVPEVFLKYILNNVGERKSGLQSRSQTKCIRVFNIGHGFQEEHELAYTILSKEIYI